jgi:large subunit ribosomal protein L35
MPKMKTHKGLRKRFKVTAKGKVKYKQPNAGHLMSGKSGNRCRRLRRPGQLKSAFPRLRALLGA